jgi:hypothetical protein
MFQCVFEAPLACTPQLFLSEDAAPCQEHAEQLQFCLEEQREKTNKSNRKAMKKQKTTTKAGRKSNKDKGTNSEMKNREKRNKGSEKVNP